MAASNAHQQGKPAAVAPGSFKTSSTNVAANGDSPVPTMSYSCLNCAKRKVKCDKAMHVCFSCRKAKLECLYQAPPPRQRKRKWSDDLDEKLARYERILHQHGLLQEDADTSPSTEATPQEPISLRWTEPGTSKTGKLLAGQGKSRYIDSSLWRKFGDDEMQRMYDDDDEEDGEDQTVTSVTGGFASDPLTGAFMGSQQNLLPYHPTPAHAMALWKIHVENVEPICKVLHIPSTSKMVEMASQQPAMVSRNDECLLFAIYHFAVFSMTEEECGHRLRQSRAALMQTYHFATRQALVNASFLKTTEMSIMQALVLFLISCRSSYDPHVYWILTGVAVRIAQRIGLHRDGEPLGLPPYEIEMRRRLFYQLIPLDGMASQMSGTGVMMMPDVWDTQQPLNINDDQIWPGMTEAPEEQKGATEMMFCLTRACVGKRYAKAGSAMNGSGQFKDFSELELVINETESEVEDKYIRYCDIVNPLHLLAIALARSAITAMRLRARLPKVRNHTITDAERRILLQQSQKILDTDASVYSHASLRKYMWYGKLFFAWGLWDSLLFILTSLRRADLLSPHEVDAAWGRVEQVFSNHGELLNSKHALQIALGRLALKAWDANPSTSRSPEPNLITILRSLRKVEFQGQAQGQDDPAASVETPCDSIGLGLGDDFNIDTADWTFWDQMIKDYQSQGG